MIKEVKASQYEVYVHLAPPCGTASKAREIPIPEHLKAKGYSGAKAVEV